jgi:GNAT superfamily N-acetyltransferase
MRIREALEREKENIFKISFENWPRGDTLQDHIKACNEHENYQKGIWYLLGPPLPRTQIHSVLIFYDFHPRLKGIGSVMTPDSHRGRGYATTLINQLIEHCDTLEPCPSLLLYSEIDTTFYERFGFHVLPKKLQKKPGSPCMIRGPRGRQIRKKLPQKVPDPF